MGGRKMWAAVARGTVVMCLVLSSGLAGLVFAASVGASAPAAPAKPLYLVAVQMKVSAPMYYSEDAFTKRIDGILAKVAEVVPAGSDVLVAFPEYTGTFLVLADAPKSVYASKDLAQAIEKLTKANLLKVLWTKLTKRVSWVRALSLVKSGKMSAMYTATFSSLAKKYGYWIVAGSTLARNTDDKGKARGSGIYNTAYTYGPNGKLLDMQKKVHLVEMEMADGLDLSHGDPYDLSIVEVAGRKVAVAVCLDAFFTDALDELTNRRGAPDIFIQPTANGSEWTAWQQGDWLRGTYTDVAKDGRARVGINPMMVGEVLGLAFEGQSSIVVKPASGALATLGYTDAGPMPGFVRVAKDAKSEEILVYRMD